MPQASPKPSSITRPPSSSSVVFTVGHSTRSLTDFIAILADAGVTQIADVRAFPASRRHPQFNKDALSISLPEAGIAYCHLPALGGRRHGRKGITSRNGLWKVEAFRNYADYAETAPFRAALETLEQFAHERPTAFMCAEAVWWRCHRRLIADYLLARRWTVVHLLAPGQRQQGVITPGAVVESNGTIHYPAEQPPLLP